MKNPIVRIVSLIALTGLAVAQDPDLVQQIGEQLPGLGTVRFIGPTTVSDSGSWAAMTAYEPGCFGCGPLACVRDGSIVAARGMTLSSGYTIPGDALGPVEFDLSASGELLLRVRLADGSSILLWEDWPVLAEGDPLPGSSFPAGAVLANLDGVRVADGGRVAILGTAQVPGPGDFRFAAHLVVDAAGVQSWNVIARSGQPIGTSGVVWSGFAWNDLDHMELGEDGRLIWTPGVQVSGTSASEQVVCVDATVLVAPGAPGPLPDTVFGGASTFVGIGAGSWAAMVELESTADGAPKRVVLVDGAVVLQVGDRCSGVARATFRGFRPPLRPLPSGDLLFGGDAGGFRSGVFTLGGMVFSNRDHVDGIRSYLPGYQSSGSSSPSGQWVTGRARFGGFEGHYRLDRFGTDEDPCTLPGDSLEPNNVCSNASVVVPAAWTNLTVSSADPDWYRVTVPPGEEVSLLVSFDHAEADVDLRLWSGGCAAQTLIATSQSTSAGERVDARNQGTTSQVMRLEVVVAPTSSGNCARYRLDHWQGASIACSTSGGPLDDAFEDGDSPNSAWPLSTGTYSGLWSSHWDEDWFRLTVPAGETLRVSVSREADSDATIYGLLFDDPDLNVLLDRVFVFGTGSSRTLAWLNPSSAARDVWLLVEPSTLNGPAAQPGGCVEYGLDVTSSFDGIGTRFCPTTPNSTGLAATLYATGNTSVASNNGGLRLAAFTVPNTLGMFLYGDATQQIPVANGTLCVAAGMQGLFRLPALTAANGVLLGLVDYSNPPTPAAQIAAGSTWYFQAWYRDPAAGGAAANLSEAICVTFQP